MSTTQRKRDTDMVQETQEERRLTELPPVTSGGKAQLGLFVLELLDLLDAGMSQFTNDAGEIKQRVKLKWQVYEVIDCDVNDPNELIGQTWNQFCNYTMAQKSTLLAVSVALLQRDIPEGSAPRPVELIGGKVKMHIAEQMGRNGKKEIVWTPGVYLERAATQQPQPRGYTGPAHASNPNPAVPKLAEPGSQEPTPRQVKFLEAAARESGLTDAEVETRSMTMFGMPVRELSRRDMSTLIEWVQTDDAEA